MPGAIDATLRKFHASLNVTDLQRSIVFYRTLLGIDPAKVRRDYAKFELADPPLVLSLIPGPAGRAGSLNHAGLRMRDANELVAVQHRLEAAGLTTQREDGVECCYAKQTKFWVTDPDNVLWEVYVFHEDVEEGDDHGVVGPRRPAEAGGATAAVASAAAVAAPTRRWNHRIGELVPDRLAEDDNSLHEVMLEGTINLSPATTNMTALLDEIRRVLRPEATVSVHGLAGDRPCDAPLALPGPAAVVEHVPSVSEVAEAFARAGFTDVRIDTLSQTAHFVVNGVPMRELRLTARKPGHRPAAKQHHAIYLGPMREVVDDFGTVFRRGEPTPMNVHDWQQLGKGPMAAAFLLTGLAGPIGSTPAAASRSGGGTTLPMAAGTTGPVDAVCCGDGDGASSA